MARKKTDTRREEILLATLDQIQTRGLNGTRSSDVASALGISVGLVHYHFGSVDNMLVEAYGLYVRMAEEKLRAAAARKGTVLERLRRVVACYVPAKNSPEWSLWMEAWLFALREARVATILREQDRTWRKAVRDLIAEGVEQGEFEVVDPEAAAWRITSMLDGFGTQVTVHFNHRGRRTLERWFEDYLERELGLT